MKKNAELVQWVEWIADRRPFPIHLSDRKLLFKRNEAHGFRRVEHVGEGMAAVLVQRYSGLLALYEPNDPRETKRNMLRWIEMKRKLVMNYLMKLPPEDKDADLTELREAAVDEIEAEPEVNFPEPPPPPAKEKTPEPAEPEVPEPSLEEATAAVKAKAQAKEKTSGQSKNHRSRRPGSRKT